MDTVRLLIYITRLLYIYCFTLQRQNYVFCQSGRPMAL